MNEWTLSVLSLCACTFVGFVFVNGVDCYFCNYRVMKIFVVQKYNLNPCRLIGDLTLLVCLHNIAVDGERLIQ